MYCLIIATERIQPRTINYRMQKTYQKETSGKYKKILEFRELDISPGKTEGKQGKFDEFISPAKGYFK